MTTERIDSDRLDRMYRSINSLIDEKKALLEALKALCEVPDVAGWAETNAALEVIAKAEGK